MAKNSDFQSDKNLAHALFLQREYNISHLTYEKEFSFYTAVKEGDLKEVRKLMLPLKNEQLGRLSDNDLRNMKYHLIITIALITRFCIEGGMLPEDAYTLSDIYIRRLDLCKTETEIAKLHENAVFDFTQKMKLLKKQSCLSLHVISIIDYVYDHLHEKISLDEISAHVSMNKTYICGLFKKETGISIGRYILIKKLEAAQNMLKYSDYSSVDISNYLGFSSHSHFITAFKKETHMTPGQFRTCHYRTHFTEDAPISTI